MFTLRPTGPLRATSALLHHNTLKDRRDESATQCDAVPLYGATASDRIADDIKSAGMTKAGPLDYRPCSWKSL
jgi:hypothetical protein